MIIEEIFINSVGKPLKHTFSDVGKKLLQIETNAIYDEAFDTLKSTYTYRELEELVEIKDDADVAE